MKNLIISSVILIAFTSTTYAAEAKKGNPANRAVQAYKQVRKAKKVSVRNKLRLQIARDLQSMQLQESSLLYVYPVLKTKDVKNLSASLSLLDDAIEKTGEVSLYRIIPDSLISKLTSTSYKSFAVNETAKKLIREKRFTETENLLDKNSSLPLLATRYNLGTAYLKAGDTKSALRLYEEVSQAKASASVDDKQKGLALLGRARASYQARDWAQAAEYYRSLPKDHPYYRRALLELSWSLFRAGQFRSALSPLHTLHSDFYEGFYQPESLYLRATIMLFTCRVDETALALMTFDKTYKNAYFQMRKWLEESQSDKKSIDELYQVADAASKKSTDRLQTENFKLPFFVLRTAVDDPELDVLLRRQRALIREKTRVTVAFKNFAPLQAQLGAFLDKRIQRNQLRIHSTFSTLVLGYAEQTEGWFTLMDLIRLEIIEDQKVIAKETLYGRGPTKDITDGMSRKFFIQNGYRFWPFQGEYWRDELGNYQFVGNNLCAKESASNVK